MKRICLFCLALVLLAGSALGENSRTEFQFIIHQNGTETAVTAEILLRENEILFTSGLFPSYAFSIPGDYETLISLLDTMKSFTPFSMPDISPVLMGIAEILNPEKTEGYFSGDLFDNASVQLRGTFFINELKSILAAAAEGGTAETDTYGVVDDVTTVSEIAGLNGISVQYNLYDDGRYLILNGQEDEKTVFTVSMDFTDHSAIKSILGYSDKDSNYYWVSELSVVSETEMHYSSALFADRLKHGYRSVEKNIPVLREDWILQLSESLKVLSFTGEILPANDNVPIEIKGTFSLEKNPELAAKISFRNREESFFTFSMKADKSNVNTEGLKIINMENLSGTEKTALEAEMSGNIIPLMMKLMFALPEEYQIDLLPAQ